MCLFGQIIFFVRLFFSSDIIVPYYIDVPYMLNLIYVFAQPVPFYKKWFRSENRN